MHIFIHSSMITGFKWLHCNCTFTLHATLSSFSYHLFMRYILHIIYYKLFPYTFQLLLWTIQIFFIWFPLGQVLKVLIQKKQNQVEYNQLTPRRPAASHSHEKYSLLAPVWILVFLKTTHQSGRGRRREEQYREWGILQNLGAMGNSLA